MLRSLTIRNYALIEEISVEFECGLNIITGETGAGKSIFIDALSLLLGERATSEVVRKGAEKAVVEGIFLVRGNKVVKQLLSLNGSEAADEVIVRREISVKGQNRCFVNDSPVTLAMMKELGDALVDLHGQHDHQSLLRSETHIDFLDDFGRVNFEEYRISYRRLTELAAEKKHLIEKEEQLRQKKDLFQFQMKEIDALNPLINEDEHLEAELKILENAEKLAELTSVLYNSLYESDGAVCAKLAQGKKQLESLKEIDAAFVPAADEIKSAEVIVEELSKFLHDYNEKIEFNPQRLEEIRERLGALSLLKKKYGGSIQSILEHREKVGSEFSLAENFEREIASLEARMAEERKKASDQASKLTSLRNDAAKKFEKSIVSLLAGLGIAGGRFSVRIVQDQIDQELSHDIYIQIGGERFSATPKGADRVEFFISTNTGEDVKPLVKVASGGEVSRIMLALKSALAASERIPLLIFDEIDVGVSGRIGQAVGMSLKKLSSSHQIIAITHLPQIAGLADAHYAVEKIEDKKRTVTRLRSLEIEERVREVAKLMSGEKVTEAGLKSARELMGMKQ